MSKVWVQKLYRNILKDVKLGNHHKYRAIIEEEKNKLVNNVKGDVNVYQLKLVEQDRFMKYYINSLKHVKNENFLLESYNINVQRDTLKKVESTASYVGLTVPKN